MKNINKIISGIIFSLILLGTSKVDASLRNKLRRRDRIAGRIPEDMITGRRHKQIKNWNSKTKLDVSKEIQKFTKELEQIKPLKRENIFNDDSVIIDTININDLPSKDENQKIENTVVKIYLGKVQFITDDDTQEKLLIITMPNGQEIELEKTDVNIDESTYVITKIEVISENKTFLQKIGYLGQSRTFNILELNIKYIYNQFDLIGEKAYYTINNTLWGGNKKALTGIGIGGMMILAAGANMQTDIESRIKFAPTFEIEPTKTCSIEDEPGICTDQDAPIALPDSCTYFRNKAIEDMSKSDSKNAALSKFRFGLSFLGEKDGATIDLESCSSVKDAIETISAQDLMNLARSKKD